MTHTAQKLIVGELMVDGRPGEARFIWGLIPRERKRSLIELHRSGRMPEAREEVLADAQRTLDRFEEVAELDYCWALEAAAERWIAGHQVEAGELMEAGK